jgi:hypothetical protein
LAKKSYVAATIASSSSDNCPLSTGSAPARYDEAVA